MISSRSPQFVGSAPNFYLRSPEFWDRALCRRSRRRWPQQLRPSQLIMSKFSPPFESECPCLVGLPAAIVPIGCIGAFSPSKASSRKEHPLIRRDFIKTAGAALASTALSGSRALTEEQILPGRMILSMNRNWRYHPSKVAGAEAVGFDDSKFQRIVIPHTNIELPWHNFDDKDYEFVSTYRRRFKMPQGAVGKRVFVDFEGVMTASTVWINGVLLGEYKGGFTPFSFELTQHLRRDAENVLVVQVDSAERADIPPFGYEIDYLTFGGIYREVSLRIVLSAYIDNIFAQPKDVLSGNPSLDVNCFLAGDLAAGGSISLEAELRDGDKILAKANSTIEQSSS